ncbi:MAG: S-layer homology domain-containing protein [Clostridiales bacterium]|nr:S-layer homology domain-containing protein [Clostridiales bacterium]
MDCYYSEFVVSDGQLRTRTKACACGATLTASLTNADNLIYNGTAHKPNGVAFTVDGVTPRNDVANFNTYASNKDAGTGTVAVLDAGEVFWGIFQLTFPIAKATPVVTWNGGSTQTLTYTIDPSLIGDDQLTVPAYTTPGTVAVLIYDNGAREVVRKSVAGNGSVTIPLNGSARLEIVDNSKYFVDVPATSWAADAVAFASAHELFIGTGANQFSPNLPMSRGMLATVLHNLERNPYQPVTGAFADVNSGAWYAEGVAWAAANGIVTGYGGGQFGPNDNITREQLAVMLWRYAGRPAATSRELRFADAYRASDWALEALRWATENGIINGKGGGILDPAGQATRAETAQMLKNFMENR